MNFNLVFPPKLINQRNISNAISANGLAKTGKNRHGREKCGYIFSAFNVIKLDFAGNVAPNRVGRKIHI